MLLYDLLLDAAIVQAETQAHLSDLVGENSPYDGDWSLDLGAGMFSKASTSGADPFVARAELLGSAAPGPGTWLWAWANSAYPPSITESSALIRNFGEQYDVAELRDAEVSLGEAEPREFAWWMGRVAALLLGQLPTYTFEADASTIGAIVLADDRLRLPEPTVPRLMRSVGEALHAIPVAPRSVWAWGDVRGVQVDEMPEGLRIALPDGHAEFRFDEQDRLIDMSGQALPSD
ncbi:DUF6882 domain-containing protein [Mycobacterium syngnathidarum]